MDERDAIGLLSLDSTVEPMPVKRSLDWTFRFPPQEFKLQRGDAEDPTTGETHSVVAVSDDHIECFGAPTPNRLPAPGLSSRPVRST